MTSQTAHLSGGKHDGDSVHVLKEPKVYRGVAVMPGFLEEVEGFFGTSDLYQVFGVQKTCNEVELKRAYRKKSLLVHPDRISEDKDEATKKFQTLGKDFTCLKGRITWEDSLHE